MDPPCQPCEYCQLHANRADLLSGLHQRISYLALPCALVVCLWGSEQCWAHSDIICHMIDIHSGRLANPWLLRRMCAHPSSGEDKLGFMGVGDDKVLRGLATSTMLAHGLIDGIES